MVYAQLPHNSPNFSSTTLWFPHHITGWVFTLGRLHSFRWSFRNPDSSHAILCPFLTPHPHLHPSAEGGKNMEKRIWKFMMSQLWKDTGQFLCCSFGHNLFLWPQKRLGSFPTVLPRKGEQLKLSATVNNSF